MVYGAGQFRHCDKISERTNLKQQRLILASWFGEVSVHGGLALQLLGLVEVTHGHIMMEASNRAKLVTS